MNVLLLSICELPQSTETSYIWTVYCFKDKWRINGLAIDCSNSIANERELQQSSTKPLIYICHEQGHNKAIGKPWPEPILTYCQEDH